MYENDKTWCFWDVGNPDFKSIVQHSWNKFEVVNKGNIHSYSCDKNQYLMLPSDVFYKNVFAKIELNPNIELLTGEKIQGEPVKINNIWHIQTSNLNYTTNLIVDTRPLQNPANDDAVIWQSFLGYEIQVDTNQFSPDKFVLMDFDDSFKNGIAFIYFLPTSENRALIEYTVFSERLISKTELLPMLEKSLYKYTKHNPHIVLRVEHGILPMGNKVLQQHIDETYVFAGLFSGAARPSSGYAFQRIQTWAKNCAASIVDNAKLHHFQKDAWLQSLMDHLFLNVIKNNYQISASIFNDLFKNCDTETVIKFMSDQASAADNFKIIKSLPPLPFIKALPDLLLRKVK
jgi:lycopene beta-cyclase